MIKEIDEELHSIICTWWASKGFPILNFEVMPKGFVSFVGEKPVFATFLYTDGIMGWLAWTVANPESDTFQREKAFKGLMEAVEGEAKAKGVKAILAMTNNGSLISRFEKNDFAKGDIDVVHLVKNI